MSQIHFIGGEKGGVGKSVVARLLAQFMIDNSLPFLGFDTDRSHGALLRFYTEFTSPVVVDHYDSLDRVAEAALAQERQVVVDLAAQTHAFLARWIEDSNLIEVAGEVGLHLKYWHVMDAGRDSVDLLRAFLDQFAGRMPLVIVLNELRGEHFDMLEASGELQRARNRGAQVVRLRKLPDATMQKIDQYSLSFWAALNVADKDHGALGFLERQRVKTWLTRTAHDFAPLVGPPAPLPVAVAAPVLPPAATFTPVSPPFSHDSQGDAQQSQAQHAPVQQLQAQANAPARALPAEQPVAAQLASENLLRTLPYPD